MSNKIRLFVDMDGTLATFTPVSKMETLYEEGYFKKLSPISNMVNAIKNIVNSKDIDVYILSACLDSPFAKKEKNEWLDEYLPMISKDHRIFCEYGKEKTTFISNHVDSDVLLDDYTKNLNEWNGVGIKILNGINDTNRSWKGERISSACEPNILAYTIKNTILKAITSRRSISKEKELAQKEKGGSTTKPLQRKELKHER